MIAIGKHYTKIAVFLGAGAILALLLLSERNSEPTYNSRPLSEWLMIAHTNGPDGRIALLNLGTNSLPFLLKWIRHEPPEMKRTLYSLLQRHPRWGLGSPLGHWLSDDAAEHRAHYAVIALGVMGTNATPLAPELKRLSYQHTDVGYRALEALGFMGTNALPQLVTILIDGQHPYRPGCARIIGDVIDADPSVAESLTPILAQCLRGTNRLLVLKASDAVAHPGIAVDYVVPPLIQNLSSPDELIRIAATNALETIAPQVLTTR